MDSPFELRIQLVAAICDVCGEAFGLDRETCPSCGDDNEAHDPRTAGINAVRADALEATVTEYAASSDPPDVVRDGERLTLTDEQFMNFFTEENLISARLIERPRLVVAALDLGSESAIRSASTANAIRELARCADETKVMLGRLIRIRVDGQLDAVHGLSLALYREVLRLHRAVARALSAYTPEELASAQYDLQAALDQAADTASGVGAQIEVVDVARLHPDFAARLTALTGRQGAYQYRGTVDLAAVYADLLSPQQSRTQRVERAAACFHGSIPREFIESLGEESVDVLLLLAAEVHLSHNPISLAARCATFVDVLDRAIAANEEATTSLVTAAEDDIEDAHVALLSLVDVLNQLTLEDLPVSAQRLQLSNTYNTLTEWVFRRLVNLLLGAKFCIDGKARPYEVVARMSFGEKYHTLSQARDPRYVAALLGVAKVIRNAGAHGDVDLSGERVTFRQTDRNGVQTVETHTDDEFVRKLVDLLLTCQALSIASAVVRLKHHRLLPEARMPTKDRLRSQTASILIGRWNLTQPKVAIVDGTVVLSVRSVPPITDASTLLPAVSSVAVLFPNLRTARLDVHQAASDVISIEVDTEDARAFLDAPTALREYVTLRILQRARLTPAQEINAEKYKRWWTGGSARLLYLDLARLRGLARARPPRITEYEDAITALGAKARMVVELLSPHEPPTDQGVHDRERLLEAVSLMLEGLKARPHRTGHAERILSELL